MDKDIAGWILEFLLGQSSISNRMLNNLIRVLPLPNNNLSLKKRLILRKMEFDIKNGKTSDHTIEFLERIEEMDLIEGSVEVSEAMKAAYCTLAMHCTAKSIEGVGGIKEKYSISVRRIWRGRIRKFEISDVSNIVGLVEQDLSLLICGMETGVLDADICETVVEKVRGVDVLNVLGRYIEEAKEKMGPSFIELACETILGDDGLRKIMGLNEDKDSTPTVDVNSNSKGTNEASQEAHVRQEPVGHRGGYNSISTPEVKKVQEALRTSCFELHEAVKDPLPEALLFAKSLKPNTNEENENMNRKGKNVEASGNDDEEGSPSPTRPHLPSPKNKPASPLSLYKEKKLVKQRPKRRWSTLEEDTLRTGVQKYGKGNWRMILFENLSIFEGRTEVGLKDKWRNMTRYQQ